MTLIRYNPRILLDFAYNTSDLHDRIDRLFSSFLDDKFEGVSSNLMNPPVDITESEDSYSIEIDLPGINKDEVKVSIENDILTISGERKQKKEEKSHKYYCSEVSYGNFTRSFKLNNLVDVKKIEANHENGVLRLNLPKAEVAKPKAVEIQVK